MARGSADFEDLKKFAAKLEAVQKSAPDFTRAMANKLAASLLELVRPLTLKDTGALRDAWKVSRVTYGAYTATIRAYNDLEYALYVEAGHRTRDHEGYVPGVHMLAISTADLQMLAPKLIEERVYTWLAENLK